MADWRKANPARRGTNIDEFDTNAFAHKYLLKRPRTHESEPVSRITSRASLAGLEADDTLIFNPAVEKREPSPLLISPMSNDPANTCSDQVASSASSI